MSALRTIGILALLGGGVTTVASLPSVMAPETGDDTAAPAVASVEPDSRLVAPEAVMAGADEARERLEALFAETDSSPEAVARLAASLIADLEGDPLAMARAANSISESASRAMTFIAGIVLEPIDGPSVLGRSGLAPDPEQILAAESIIADAMGRLFETIATAAGDEATRAQILDLPEPPVQDIQAVSES